MAIFPPVGTLEQNLRKDINYLINKSKNPDYIYALIQHLKIVQQRLKIKSGLSGESQPQEKDVQSNVGKVDAPNEKSSETWCWKLYEKTIKAVNAAILGKVNPS